MKLILSFGLLFFAMTFCGLSDRLKSLTGSSNSNTATNSASNSAANKSSDVPAEKATLTGPQQAIQDGSVEIKWPEQGLTWKLPPSWKKMSTTDLGLNYGSPDNAFLIATISNMPDTMPTAVSLKATYESALELLKQGKYEKVRWLEIDGVKGVEWWEAMPESKTDPRRHQWISFRNYQGQNQQMNIMLSTAGDNFDKHRDEFPAIMYSMKIPKG
jgi:hypothetical protein